MKNYIIILLLVCLVVSISFLYRSEKKQPFDNFPGLHSNKKIEKIENPFFLYLFFSETNCMDCLEIIEVLNSLPEQFIVFGVVPDKELKEEAKIRSKSGAAFEFIGAKKFKKYLPNYWPTLIGVSKGNNIFCLYYQVSQMKKFTWRIFCLHFTMKPIHYYYKFNRVAKY